MLDTLLLSSILHPAEESHSLEAIAARQAGMEILGFSLITNMAAGIQTTPLSHREVIEAGEVSVDGAVETRRGAQVRPGQTVTLEGVAIAVVAG